MEELSKWKGQYISHTRDPTIILEIVASYDLWIWYAFFGLSVTFGYDQIDNNGPESVSYNPTCNLMQFIERHNSIRDRGIHSQLQADLVEHLWQLQGQL